MAEQHGRSASAVALRGDNARMVGKLLVVAALMFAFGYALVPVYRAICSALGINVLSVSERLSAGAPGKASATASGNTQVDLSRTITVEFDANARGVWDFKPAQRRVQELAGYDAAAFRGKKVDAAVTWEPDLSGAVKSREDDAHLLVTTAAATNVIADCLVARADVIAKSPESIRDFVHGWFDGIDEIARDPASSNAVVAKALKLQADDVSGMLSGLKLTPFADNALFFGLSGGEHAQITSLFDTAFIVWRKQGVVSKAVDSKDYVDSRFVAALADKYQGQKVVEPFRFDPKAAKDPKARAIVNKSLTIYFTPGSDEIMSGSNFTLDSLGDTMTAFGNTFLRIEGNTDAKGSAKLNKTLSQKRAESVKKYLEAHYAIPDARFQTIGQGAENPVADNTTEAGRQQNRRTDIKVVLNAN